MLSLLFIALLCGPNPPEDSLRWSSIEIICNCLRPSEPFSDVHAERAVFAPLVHLRADFTDKLRESAELL